MVSCDPAPRPVCQVWCHWPFFSDCIDSCGSPLEKPSRTVPLLMGFPQSSLTSATSATGHPAGTLNAAPRLGNDGMSLVGVHGPGVLASPAVALLPDGAGETITFSGTDRKSTRLNSSHMSISY